MVDVRTEPVDGTTAQDLAHVRAEDGTAVLWWLGQAGFAFRVGGFTGIIDPYLSDRLTKKYRDTAKAHGRLMPAPIAPEDVHDLDVVLCSHAHSDHMDADTLPVLARTNPRCEFMVPAAEVQRALDMGLSRDRLRPVNAGDSACLADLVTVHVLPAAHEALKTDADGNHHFISYVLALGDLVLFHSGDCVPYDGLEEALRCFSPDVALLPVNGRDDRRRALNIIGNFTFDEAADLCLACGIPVMVGHHFGMFAVNTVPREELERKVAALPDALTCLLPDVGRRFVVRKHVP